MHLTFKLSKAGRLKLKPERSRHMTVSTSGCRAIVESSPFNQHHACELRRRRAINGPFS